MLGALFLLIGGVLLYYYPIRGSSPSTTRLTLAFVSVIVIASLLFLSSTHSLALKQGLPLTNQILAWSLLFVSLSFIFFYPRTHSSVLVGLTSVYLAVAPSFILLSIAYEVLFYAALALQLFAWILVELQYFAPSGTSNNNNKDSVSPISSHDARRAVIYVCFFLLFLLLFLMITMQIIMCYVAMFGTGNVASISSFELSSTYRFLTVFSPFVMTSLLIWKLAAPIVVVSCVYFGLTKLLQIPRPAVFLLVVGLAGILIFHL